MRFSITLRRGWVRTAIVLAALALAATMAWWMFRAPNLSHDGKDVYYWMLQNRSSDLERNTGLKAIGTNAVPYLARALGTKETRYDRYGWVRQPWAQALFAKLPAGFTWKHSARETRRAAAYSLLAFGPDARPALPELHAALTDATLDAQTQFYALGALMKIDASESFPVFLAAWPLATNLGGSSFRYHLVVALSLRAGEAPDRCLPIFLHELGSDSVRINRAAAGGASAIGHKAHKATPALRRLLMSTNDSFGQFVAAVALGRVTNGVPDLLPRLHELADGSNDKAAAGAALTLWRWGEPAEQSVAILTNLLGNIDGKGVAADYLGVMGTNASSAVPALLEASQQEIGVWVDGAWVDRYDRARCAYDRARCALAVLRIAGSNDKAIGEIEAALAHPGNAWVRGEVARQVGMYPPGNAWVRGEVARQIGNLGTLAAPLLPALRHRLNDPERDVSHAAEAALGKIEAALANEQ